jgi:hypothetical protein
LFLPFSRVVELSDGAAAVTGRTEGSRTDCALWATIYSVYGYFKALHLVFSHPRKKVVKAQLRRSAALTE